MLGLLYLVVNNPNRQDYKTMLRLLLSYQLTVSLYHGFVSRVTGLSLHEVELRTEASILGNQ